MTKKSKVKRNRAFLIILIFLISYGMYKGYGYAMRVTNKNSITVEAQTPSERQRQIDSIKESEKFRSKIANLAEQEAIQDEINGKQEKIAKLTSEVKALTQELESKRNAGLSL